MKIRDNWASICIDFLDKKGLEDSSCFYALASRCYEYELSDFDGFALVAKEFGNDDLLPYIERMKYFWEIAELPDFEYLNIPSRIQADLLRRKRTTTRKRIKDSLVLTISRYQEYQVVKAVIATCIDAAIKQLSAEQLVEDAQALAQQHLPR